MLEISILLENKFKKLPKEEFPVKALVIRKLNNQHNEVVGEVKLDYEHYSELKNTHDVAVMSAEARDWLWDKFRKGLIKWYHE